MNVTSFFFLPSSIVMTDGLLEKREQEFIGTGSVSTTWRRRGHLFGTLAIRAQILSTSHIIGDQIIQGSSSALPRVSFHQTTYENVYQVCQRLCADTQCLPLSNLSISSCRPTIQNLVISSTKFFIP